jgi:hypothetical protein
MSDKKTVQIGIRVTEDLRDAVALCAIRETRSISQQVEHFIKQGLREYHLNHPDFLPQFLKTFEFQPSRNEESAD